MREPLSQEARRVSFEQIRNECRAKTRWRTDKDMNMVDVGLQGEQSQALLFTTLGNQPFCFDLYFASENAPPILGNPYKVIGD
jgi:hypothetical protein